MIQSSPQGSTIDLDCAFRDADGYLADPANPRVTIKATDNSVIVNAGVPAKRSTGLYRYSLSLDLASQLGVWVANWTATLSGVALGQQAAFEVTEVGTLPQPPSSGTDSWVVGTTAGMELETRDDDGLLVEATGVSLTITDSLGDLVVSGVAPVILRTGLYRYNVAVPISGPLGIWDVVWIATVDGRVLTVQDAFEVVADPYGAAHPYGASIAGVQAHIPEQLITETTQPSLAQVSYFIDAIASEVSLRIGNYTTTIPDAGLQDRVTAFARYVVNMGAAATAFDASYPARSAPNNSGYGNVLWSRYEAVLAELIQLVDDAVPGDPGAGVPSALSGPLVSSGPPMFYAMMEF